MISLVDEIDRCAELASALMLHVCSTSMHGSMLAKTSEIQSELQSLTARAHKLARHF